MELPAGTYKIKDTIYLPAITLKTKGVATAEAQCGGAIPCATILADSNFHGISGLTINSENITGLLIDHVVYDGNRQARLGSYNAGRCALQEKIMGMNARINKCTNCQFRKSVSRQALCGNGLDWDGDGGVIDGNVFSENGDHANFVADGATIWASNSTITNNTATENSDVGLIFGRGNGSAIMSNYISQSKQRAFAAMMFSNFQGSPTAGDFTNANFTNNTIYCAPNSCFFGINIGENPWQVGTPNIIGGNVVNNTIYGGIIGINVDGAGTASAPLTVSGNATHITQPETTGGPEGYCGSKSSNKYLDSSRYNKGTGQNSVNGQGSTSNQPSDLCIGI